MSHGMHEEVFRSTTLLLGKVFPYQVPFAVSCPIDFLDSGNGSSAAYGIQDVLTLVIMWPQ